MSRSQSIDVDRPGWKASPLRWLFVGTVLALVLCVRVPHLGQSLLNPDEAQYLSFASYLNAAGLSAFDRPILHVYTQWIAQVLGRLFGDYELMPMRILSMGALSVVSIALSVACQRSLGTLAAWAATLFFVYESCFFEGISVNREMFCLVAIFLSWTIYLRQTPQLWWSAFAAGVVAGSSLWFKEQALFLTWAIPLDMAFRAWRDGSWREGFRAVGIYILGGAAVCVAMAMPMIVRGTFDQQWKWLTEIELAYAMNRQTGGSIDSVFYARHMYLDLPFRNLAWVGYIGWVSAAVQIFSRRSASRVPTIVALAMWSLPLALFAFQLGKRMCLHYFLFVLPVLAVLIAFVLADLLSRRRDPLWATVLSLAIIIPSLVADSLLPTSSPSETWADQAGAKTLQFFLAMLVVLQFAIHVTRKGNLRRKSSLARWSAVFLVATELASLVQTFHREPGLALMRGSSLQDVRSPAAELARRTVPEDRVFVWGWRPEIYFYARRPAASSFVISVDLLADPNPFLQAQPDYNKQSMNELLKELDRTRPRYFVDAWLISLFGANFNLQKFPPLVEYIQKNYFFEGHAEGCLFYRRKDGVDVSEAATLLPPVESSLDWLDQRIAAQPQDIMLLLNKADILFLDGKLDPAEKIYRSIQQAVPGWDSLNDRLRRLSHERENQKH